MAVLLLTLTLFSSNAYAANYTVLPKDSLYKIGQLFNTSVSTLKSNNNLSSNMIYPGQALKVTAEIYTVKSGDSLYLIAKRSGITLDNLRIANNKWDNLILPGQKLLLPALKISGVHAGSTSASSTGSTTGSSNNTSNSGTVISYTKSEVDLLARLITAEAIGEPYDTMVGVGAVVVNRVQSSDWPNTISSVINHVTGGYYQFSPVQNGYINKPPTDDALRAAWAALYGADPSNEALFYYDTSSTNAWIRSKPVTARIGNMIFAKQIRNPDTNTRTF